MYVFQQDILKLLTIRISMQLLLLPMIRYVQLDLKIKQSRYHPTKITRFTNLPVIHLPLFYIFLLNCQSLVDLTFHPMQLWNTKDLSLVGVLKGHKRAIWSIEFSPVDQALVSSSGDKTIKIWSITDFSCLKVRLLLSSYSSISPIVFYLTYPFTFPSYLRP